MTDLAFIAIFSLAVLKYIKILIAIALTSYNGVGDGFMISVLLLCDEQGIVGQAFL